ncbi:DUF6321 domain-containing protein [Pedosphaera parvula]|nr:DUF6321 domain-containing protein [Pedosphaera parvula]
MKGRTINKRRAIVRPANVKNPRGGLTPAGRQYYAKTTGAHLRPGVKKPEKQMTAEELKRKGSFLRRHYATPRGKRLVDAKGQPTRYALQAQAWGEPIPRSMKQVRELSRKGKRLLTKSKATGAIKKPRRSRQRAKQA